MTLKAVGSDPSEWEGTHIAFRFQGIPEGKKTGIWFVSNKDNGSILGEVRWFSRWRKYCFFPDTLTVFEEVCLTEIAEFIKQMTQEHKTGI